MLTTNTLKAEGKKRKGNEGRKNKGQTNEMNGTVWQEEGKVVTKK
jgi:hypothetical protein